MNKRKREQPFNKTKKPSASPCFIKKRNENEPKCRHKEEREKIPREITMEYE